MPCSAKYYVRCPAPDGRKDWVMSYDGTFGPELVIQHTGQVFPLPASLEPLTIGRAPDNVLVLSDPQVSSHHATIFLQAASGRYVLQDLGSTNGTYLNERRISQPEFLRHGDLVRAGNTTIYLKLEPAVDSGLPLDPDFPPVPDEGEGGPAQRFLLPALVALLLVGVTVTCFVLAAVLLLGTGRGVPSVVFRSPTDGFQVMAGTEVLLEAVASGASDITSLQLSVDGQLVATSTSPNPAGTYMLTVSSPWISDAPGDHRVTAVAFTAKGKKSKTESIRLTVLSRDPEEGALPTDTITPPADETATPTPLPAAPQIEYFRADPPTISAGGCSLLQWGAVTEATEVQIEPDIGGVGTPGSISVCPSQTTTYVLTAVGPGGNSTASAMVVVSAAFADLVVESIGFAPNPPVRGQGTEVRITIRNIGDGAASAFDWEWQAGSDARFSGRVTGLAAREATSVTVRWTPANSYASLSTVANVDAANEVLEIDESNNQLVAVVKVIEAEAGPTVITLTSDPAVDGYRANDGSGSTRQDVLVGNGEFVEPTGELVWRGFMSFDLTGIPRGASIVGAELRFYQAKVGGDPYGKLGSLVLDHVDLGSSLSDSSFGTPALDSYTLPVQRSANNWYTVANQPVATWLAQDLAAGRVRFQVRLRFVQEQDGDGQEDFSGIESGNNFFGTGNVPQLIVTYE
jgi:hypothetical protein